MTLSQGKPGTHTKSFELYYGFFASEGLVYQPETEAATADQILPMVKADLGIGFVPEDFPAGVEGVPVIETEKPLPEREIRVVKRKKQALSIAAKEPERLICVGQREFFSMTALISPTRGIRSGSIRLPF